MSRGLSQRLSRGLSRRPGRRPGPGLAHGRRGALAGASAALVCLGAVLTACVGSGGGGGGYAAVGAGGDTPRASGAAAPTADVTLVPLDGASASAGPGRVSSAAGDNSLGGRGGSGPTASGAPDGSGSAPSGGRAGPGRTHGGSPSPSVSSGGGGEGGGTSTGGSATPGGPAALSVSTPVREATDKRWCEKVTVSFHNTGGSAARSGTVTFGTHIIGALGIDWATIESTEDLPAPIAAGATRKKTWTVCVDAWRVPLGTHIETRDVSVQGE
ncbi:hypothetical protein AB0D71_09670 [Streptomyces avermitilis]|uniref:hypothetical protein n=1 Tax=Streptomyces avermitilis TaxID=33903 RepID=UPI0033C00B4E